MTAVREQQAGSRIVLGGALVDLRHRDEVVSTVRQRLVGISTVDWATVDRAAVDRAAVDRAAVDRAAVDRAAVDRGSEADGTPVEAPPRPAAAQAAGGGRRGPLAIGSANLDHVHHFGRGGRSAADIDVAGDSPEWLILLDGAPMVRRATSLTGRPWPLLAGSDLLPVLLDTAQAAGARVGFLGGTAQMHDIVRPVLADRYPELTVAGFWAPERADLADRTAAARLADRVREAGTDLLVVGLGKPRQERWIQRHASASGARVLLAFGAATDFLAGTVSRAPSWVRNGGVEWLYRLSREPRRLARRYCVQGPPAMWRLWTDSRR